MRKLMAFYVVLHCFTSSAFAQKNNEITFKVSLNHNNAQLLLPIPNRIIPVNAIYSLSEQGVPIKASFSTLNTWGNSKGLKYSRLVLIDLEHVKGIDLSLSLQWTNNNKPFNIHGLKVNNPILVYPSQDWLSQALLLHPKDSQSNNDWYIEPQKQYARYVTNQSLLTIKGYPKNKSSQWLYDRPQSIYQLFIMSDEREWLTKANKLAHFYISNIDEGGKFKLKKQFDPKMLMPKGVLYRYLLSADAQAKSALIRMYKRSFDWDESYSSRRGFWTERNQAAALNVAVAYWELTNDPQALTRINAIIDATVKMTFNPENDWPLRGCPQHSFKAHEGWGDNSPACSPWMMALLGDSLWRFYQLTSDKRAASLLDAFGDFVLDFGLYYGDKRVNNIVIPKYIVSMENPSQEEQNQWTDPQHICDVAGLLGKSVYVKNKSGHDSFLLKTLFNALLEQCQGSYKRLKKEVKRKQNKAYWSIKPPRRFAWMYSTTSDLPWLNSLLNSTDYIRE